MKLLYLRLALSIVGVLATRAIQTQIGLVQAIQRERYKRTETRADVAYGHPSLITVEGFPMVRHANGKTSEARGVRLEWVRGSARGGVA